MNAPFKAPDHSPAAVPAERFLDALFDAGLLTPLGVDGLYARSGEVEDVIEALMRLYGRWGAGDGATRIHFPPGMPRPTLERSGYLKSFPQLAGCVHAFMGDEAGHARLLGLLAEGGDWTAEQAPTSIALTPAACYPLYPSVAARGPLPEGGALYELSSYCFRHEPSQDPARMQLFRMKEFVRIGSPGDVTAFRATWMERGPRMIASLGLPHEVDVANDPFFGRAGKMLASNQREGALKFELLIPVASDTKPTACLSFNYHQDHFGKTWGIAQADGSPAHSACVGIGLERTALALFRHHGTDLAAWPAPVRAALWG